MKNTFRSSLVPLTMLAASLLACASENADSDPVGSDDSELSWFGSNPSNDPAPPRNAADPFFANHPRTGTFPLSTGRIAEIPWRTQDADMWNLLSLADANEIEALMKDSGYKPYTTTVDGKRLGIVRVVMLNYRDTDDGPYKAFVLSFDSYKDDGGPARTFAWTNPYSIFVPAYTGALQYFYRGAVTGSHVPTAHELLGLDKRQGFVSLVTVGGQTSQWTRFGSARDAQGRAIMNARVTFDPRPATQLTELNLFAQAFGFPDAAHMPPTPSEAYFPGACKDPLGSGTVRTHDAWYSFTPVLNRWNAGDTLTFDASSEFGRLARKLKIRPQVVAVDPHLQMTITPQLAN